MRVHCFTNINDYSKESWPTAMCARPVKGDLVESRNGKKLKAVGITHSQMNKSNGHVPFLIIELHN